MLSEAIEIHKLPENINRDDGLRLKAAWLPILKNNALLISIAIKIKINN